jgi:hypothetical protein
MPQTVCLLYDYQLQFQRIKSYSDEKFISTLHHITENSIYQEGTHYISLLYLTLEPICRYRLISEVFHLCSVITIPLATRQYVKSSDANSCKNRAAAVKKNPISDFQHCTILSIAVIEQRNDRDSVLYDRHL